METSTEGWRPLHATLRPANATAFDPACDLLWLGNHHGFVESLFLNDLSRYTAYRANLHGNATTQIIADDKAVLSLGLDTVKCASRRGLTNWILPSHLSGQSGYTSMTFSSARASDLVISSIMNNGLGVQPDLQCVNPSTGTVIRKAEAGGAISHLSKTSHYCISGTLSGTLSIRDPRSLSIEHTVQAHPGGLIALEGDGNMLLSIGYTVMQGHPVPEQLVKTWDIRTLRPLMPVNVPGGPALIKAHPRIPQTLLIVSQQNQFQMVNMNNLADMAYHQIETNGFVTSMSVSTTGEAVAFSDSEGLLHLWSTSDVENVHFSRGTEEIILPDPPADVPKNIQWTANTPLNLIGMPHYTTQLLSAIPLSDYVTPYTPLFSQQAKVDPAILKTMRMVDFIGYAINPRNKRRNEAMRSSDVKKAGDKRRLDVPQFRSQKARNGQDTTQDGDEEDTTEVIQPKEEISKFYRKVEIKYSKFGVEDFDFGFYNKTSFSGLETHIANSYTHSLLQLLRSARPIRKVAEAHTYENCAKENCLLCEAGFLFRMLQDAKGLNCQASNFSRAFSATQHDFYKANALGLMDTNESASAVSYSTLIQTFHQFLLDIMSAEAEATPVANHHIRKDVSTSKVPSTVQQIFGMQLETSSTCPHCGFKLLRGSVKTVLDLQYPRKPLSNESSAPADFLSIMKNSLAREATNRTVCTQCNQPAHFRVRRSIPAPLNENLPAILAINAGVKSADHLSIWQDSQNKSEHFLLQQFGFSQVNGIVNVEKNSAEVDVTYELHGLVCQIQAEDEPAHLVTLTKMPTPDGSSSMQWILFNDFLVKQIDLEEAMSFMGSWKIPAVVFYQRTDVDKLLDYSTLPQRIEPSILSMDISISRHRNMAKLAHTTLTEDELPKKGTLVAIDAEFVSLQEEEAEVHSDGTRKVIRPSRMSLARVSVLRGEGVKTGMPFIDDYIHTSEKVEDYLTEFSGIRPGDLDPIISQHTLVSLKVAYKKLRLLVDLGCIFIGHGLNKDFRIINIFVPPSQVIDTVNIYHLPARHRKLSLRFLSYVVLHQDIQSSGTHDSIEDARTALQLYEEYQRMDVEGLFEEELEEIYREGKRLGWKVPGAIEKSPQPIHTDLPGRTGCATCKKRRKKCPEVFENGSCLRCIEGGFECILDKLTKPIERTSTTPNAKDDKPAQGDNTPSPRNNTVNMPSAGDVQVEWSAPAAQSTSAPQENHINLSLVQPITTSSSPSQHQLIACSPVDNQYQLNQNGISLDSIMDFGPVSPLGYNIRELQEFAPGNDNVVLDNLLPGLISPPRCLTPENWMDAALAEIAQQNGVGALTTTQKGKERAKDGPLTLFYHHVMLSWFAALPDRLRRQLIEHYSNISDCHEVTRAARNAVSGAYIARLRKLSKYWSGNLHFKRGHKLPENLLPEGCRDCYPDPDQLCQEAMRLLRDSDNEQGVTLESKLWAIMDMQLFELVWHGAGGAHNMLAVGDDLVRAAFGPTPSLDLSSLRGYSTFSLRVYALADIVRGIALRIPTTFDILYRAPTEEERRDSENVAYDHFLGLPQSLCVLMAAVSNLCASVWNRKATPDVVAAAAKLEEQIRAWRPISIEVEGTVTSVHWVERVSMQECWRLAAIILLYTLVLGVGPLHPTVRDAFNQILALLKSSLTMSSLLDATVIDLSACFSVCPAFIAGALAMQPEDRKLCKYYIQACGPEAVWENDLQVLALTWQQSDSAGYPVDWFAVAHKANLVVAFF